MYFNENKENTNIDNEFSKKSEFNFANYKRPLIIVGAVILFIIIIIIIISLMKGRNNYYLTLNGDSEITIYQGATYYELGFVARNGKKDVSSEVITKNNVTSETTGTYTVIYTLYNKTAKRIIHVIEAPEVTTFMHVTGNKEMTIKVGEDFVDPGCEAIDVIDGNLTEQVSVNGSVNTAEKGTYTIVYSVTNSKGITTTEARTVTVE